jgi:hypothetical protein
MNMRPSEPIIERLFAPWWKWVYNLSYIFLVAAAMIGVTTQYNVTETTIFAQWLLIAGAAGITYICIYGVMWVMRGLE